ncbi:MULTISPECIES: hypothetical protein [Bacillales]|uniref:DUF3221 domain-containing protein n=1 Tax=Paenibacillus xylanexedens TaxID=528191 RepID=A0ABS4RZY6_PAEXY|nr:MULTISPECIES: hypothetical protein [Paenibacillus]MBP2248453.1 hypothetical protein [Paenibacillus xylanexedens]
MSSKLKVLLTILVILVLSVSGCTIAYQIENNIIIKKATPIGIEYFKSEYDVTVEFTDSQVFDGYVYPKVNLYGYVNNDINEKVSISINYNTYEVENVGGPKWLFQLE